MRCLMENNEELSDEVAQSLTEETNTVIDYFDGINWTEVFSNLIVVAVKIIVILIIMSLAKAISQRLINLFFKRREEEHGLPPRYKTLHQVATNVVNVLIGFIGVMTIFEIIGLPVASLLAGAGVIGLAVSFGAQGFVSDLINGLTILFQEKLALGEYVILEDVEGTVIDMNLVTTVIKANDGTIHYVPNREIKIISNQSRADMQVLIQVMIAPSTDLDKVRDVMEDVHARVLPNMPEVTQLPGGVNFSLHTSGNFMAQVILYTENGAQFKVRFKLIEEYNQALTDAGIKLPLFNTL